MIVVKERVFYRKITFQAYQHQMKQRRTNKSIEQVFHDTVDVTYIDHILRMNSTREIDLNCAKEGLKGDTDCQVSYR